jgi:hypothetical protein
MARADEDKQRLVDQLAESRQRLMDDSLIVREKLNVQRQLTKTFHRYSWGWMSLAAILGWILSRLPARKKKIYIEPGNHRTATKLRTAAKLGIGLDLGLKIWGALWSIARPILTAYLTKKFKVKAQSPGLSD